MASVFASPLPFMSAESIFLNMLDTYFPFVVPSMTLAHTLILAAVVLHAVDGALFEAPGHNKVLFAIIAVFTVAAISGAFGVAPMRSAWGTFERMGGVMSLGLWSLYAWMLFISFRGHRVTWPVDAFILAGALVGVLAWAEGLGAPNSRPVGVFGNQSFTGAFMAVAAVAALGMAAREWITSGYSRDRMTVAVVIMYAATALALGMMTHIMGSRGAMLALYAGSTAMMAAWVLTELKALKGQSLERLMLVFFAASVVGLVAGTALVLTLDREGIVDGSLRDRAVVAMVVVETAGDRPLRGYGPENFGIGYHLHSQPTLMTDGGRQGYDSAHNEVMETLVTRGVAGLVAYIALWLVFAHAIRQALRADDPEVVARGLLAIGVLVTHFVVMQFLFLTLASYITFAIGGVLALGLAPVRSGDTARIFDGTPAPVALISKVAVVFVALLASVAVGNVYDASKQIALGLRADSVGRYSDAVDLYGEAAGLAPGKAGEIGRLISGVPAHAHLAGRSPENVTALAVAVLESRGLERGLRAVPHDWKQNLRAASVYSLAMLHPNANTELLLQRSLAYRKAAWAEAPLEMQKLTGQ